MPRLTIPSVPLGFGSSAPSLHARPTAPAPAPTPAPAPPRKVRTFIATSYDIVESGAGCCWSEDGRSFVISEAVFKSTCNVKSFIRQCNFYGFTKSRLPSPAEAPLSIIAHPLFRRGRRDLLDQIGPKLQPPRGQGGPSPSPSPSTSTSLSSSMPSSIPSSTCTPPAGIATSATGARARPAHAKSQKGGLVAALRARVCELEDKLGETEGKLQTLQELFHRVTGKRERDDTR